jgi:hypothetical protein
MAGQWFSGDEFIICITDDAPDRQASNPVEFGARLAETFRNNGVSATFVVAPITSTNLVENVAPAHRLCQKAKKENRRGGVTVMSVEPLTYYEKLTEKMNLLDRNTEIVSTFCDALMNLTPAG